MQNSEGLYTVSMGDIDILSRKVEALGRACDELAKRVRDIELVLLPAAGLAEVSVEDEKKGT